MNPQRAGAIATWLSLAAVVALCLPTLVLSYLPMTDLPQHLAVASIIEHLGDDRFGFAEHYVVDWWRAPYVVPYVLAIGLGKVLTLELAMHVVVFMSVAAYPIGVMMLLRAAGKPIWLVVLAVPLVYNRAFFWGFLNFNMSIGLALMAFALFVTPRRGVGRDIALAALALAATFSHVYGLALLVVLVGAHALCGGWPMLRERWWSLAPLVAGIGVWVWSSQESAGYGVPIDPSFTQRVAAFPRELLGGYRDSSEAVILAVLAFAWIALAHPTLPISRARIRALTTLERVAYLAFAGNLVLYFVLPQATWTAKFIHFRHAFLACALLPVVVSAPVSAQPRLLVRGLPIIVVVATIANSWGHLALFDREARRFDPILAVVPERARIVSLVFEPSGDIMTTFPYLHFAAYAQAKRGGMISMTFPAVFWNLPVALRSDAPMPKTPEGLEWNPGIFDDQTFGHFYDYALVRIPGKHALAPSARFPFELVAASPPWHLYKRTGR